MQEHIDNTMSALRLAAGATQEALAESLGVSRQTIIAIEKGNYTPSVLLALKISAYFKVPVQEIFRIVRRR